MATIFGLKVELTLAFWPFLASKSKSLSRSSASGELERESEFDFKPKTGYFARVSAMSGRNPVFFCDAGRTHSRNSGVFSVKVKLTLAN